MEAVLQQLLASPEPSVVWKARRYVLGDTPESAANYALQQQIQTSPRVRTLLSERDAQGKIPHPAYFKWRGAHWVLSILADIGYPAGDPSLRPLADQVLTWLTSLKHQKHIKLIDGRVRRCASQESNALYSCLTLGLEDSRLEILADELMRWQWPDGGWNCDKRPATVRSSFHESIIPLRALGLYARKTGSPAAADAAEHAAEVFLKRRLFRRLSDGAVMNEHFTRLSYPSYWHYNILFGLKVMAESGFISDPRCAEALDLLESKRLADGGFPAEEKFYRVSDGTVSGGSRVAWGPVSAKKMNEFVTADALGVLKAAGRLKN